ncbi:MAG: N-acetyl-alpha-D-glucosaminyl L-malate synthase BshA [Candidatus Eisenbacteria bacterium]|uniref:N-acetyl-alpha-D-glucosaminyl L-malate synthase BshA n=1 Tax=Eiseniibacteriota bacterium TaxID=2212470 RepID=A0A948RX89_UNCEI|nr:N-acetyl-alpha-D-glucosaminyl L-malate synthase BshA [Candidatus Eisenbacteria bacterium]MBU2691232.1 N-acetyl-alpha-D-glucosaminyl L-malate synthase BshA [Candidatus Eisenbacteria bacterium]
MSDRPLRIGIVCYPSSGGSGIVATDLALALARGGDQVTLISYTRPIRFRSSLPNLDFFEVQTEHYPVFHHQPYTLSLAAGITSLARTKGLDIVHAHYAVPHATAAYLAKQILAPQELPVVTTLHGTDITLVGTRPAFYETTRFSILKSDRVTTVSHWLEAETRAKLDVDIPIQVIPNFIDGDIFKPRDSSRPRCFPDDRPIIMHISNFRKVKNVPAVIEVFRRVRRWIPARLVLIGHGPERPKVIEQIRELGLQDDVLVMGLQNSIEQILPEADLVLTPSEHESFGLVALEALASGVPVITTNMGGAVEVIEDGVTGFLRDPRDLEGMTEAALKILKNPTVKEEMGRLGRASALKRFSIDTIIRQYRELYREIRP